MAEGIKDNWLLEMLKTGIIGEEWPKTAYLMVIIKDRKEDVIIEGYYDSSDHQSHAEIKMLEEELFQDWVKHFNIFEKAEIVMTLNYSPCWECAPKLIKFYNDNKSSIEHFTIRFAHPYNTKNKEERPLNEKCLGDLDKAGITLEAMNEKTWFDLVMQEMFHLEPDKVRERDLTTRDKLKELELLPEETSASSEDKKLVQKTLNGRIRKNRHDRLRSQSASPKLSKKDISKLRRLSLTELG